jgi:hypothetical protein
MASLGMNPLAYADVSEKRGSLSYVIINPRADEKLKAGDMM